MSAKSLSVNLSYLGRVIDECKELLSGLGDSKVFLKFVKRSANMMAHFVARHSSSIAERIWRGDYARPDFISVMLND